MASLSAPSIGDLVAASTGVSVAELGSIEAQLRDRPAYLHRAASLFMRIDANSDGVLTRAELNDLVGTKKAEFMMHDLDAENDGQVHPSEWSTYWVKCKSAGVNVDGRLNWIEKQVVLLEQGRAASKQSPPLLLRCKSATDIPDIMERATSIFLDIDTDQSGSLGREELYAVLGTTERVTPALKELDSNQDGKVSVAEFCQWAIRMYTDHDKDFALDHLAYLEQCVLRVHTGAGGAKKDAGAADAANAPALLLRQASATAIPDILRRATSSFLRLDTNANGSLDRAEILAFAMGDAATADEMFADLDTDNNGKITNIEWQKFFITKYNTAGGDATLRALAVIEEKLKVANL
jgi:Ca2+-binding EF-hand superfamily protein